MPTYEYQCRKCGRIFEVFHGLNEPGPQRCPDKSCRGKPKRLLSAGAGLIFKGSGFYITDYKRPGSARPEGDEAPKTEKTEKKEPVAGEGAGAASGERAAQSPSKQKARRGTGEKND